MNVQQMDTFTIPGIPGIPQVINNVVHELCCAESVDYNSAKVLYPKPITGTY
jgi:hypothetical protein